MNRSKFIERRLRMQDKENLRNHWVNRTYVIANDLWLLYTLLQQGRKSMHQPSFSDIEYSLRKRTVKREEFLKAKDDFIPWDEWVSLIAPYYPSWRHSYSGSKFDQERKEAARPAISRNTSKYFTTGSGDKRHSGIFHRLPLHENFKRNNWAKLHSLASEFDDLPHIGKVVDYGICRNALWFLVGIKKLNLWFHQKILFGTKKGHHKMGSYRALPLTK